VREGQGAFAEAGRWLEIAEAEYAALGDDAGAAQALAARGRVYMLQGDYAAARAVLTGAGEQATAAAAPGVRALVRYYLGAVALDQGDYPTAQADFAASLAERRAGGDRVGMARSLGGLGVVAYQQGEHRTAQALFAESLALDRELGNRWGIASSLNNLGLVADSQGESVPARTLYVEGLTLFQELGDRWGSAASLNNLGNLALRQGDRTAARRYLAESLQHAADLGPGAMTQKALVLAAGLLAPAEAAGVLGTVTALLAAQSGCLEPLEQQAQAHVAAEATAALGPAVYAAAFAAGQARDWEEAVVRAQAGLAAGRDEPSG
jgi:tetratricopeptide (TPR) repeat protein